MKSSFSGTVKVVAMVVVGLFSASAFAGARRAPATVNGVVNINTASEKELDALPGVGPKQAKGIVAYRAAHPFNRTEELVKVKGFGKKKFEKLKAHLAVNGPSNLTVMKGGMAAPQARNAPSGR